MPHATHVPHATFLLIVAGVLTIAVVVGTMGHRPPGPARTDLGTHARTWFG